MDIELPDGRIVTGVPEGTTKKQIAERFNLPYEDTSQKNSFADTATNIVGTLGTSAAKVAGGVLGLPGSIGDMLGHKNGIDPFSLMSNLPNVQEMQTKLLEGTGTPRVEPESRLGKLAAAAGEGALSGALMPLGALSQLASAGIGAASGVGSEGAGQLTQGSVFEPYARFAGALAGPAMLSGASSLAKGAADLYKGATGILPVDNQLKDIISSTLKKENITPNQALMQHLSNDRSLADISTQLASEAALSSRQTPIAASTARSLSEGNVSKSLDRIRGAIKDFVSSADDNIVSAKDNVLANMKERALPHADAFNAIRGKGITEVAPKRVISDLSSRFPDVMNKILKDSNSLGEPIENINKVTLGNVDNVIKGIDRVLYGSDDFAKGFQSQFGGGPNELGRELSTIRSKLSEYMKNRSPDYKAMKDIYSGDLAITKAMDEGASFLKGDIDQLSKKFSEYTSSEKEGLLAGMARGLRDRIPNLGRENDTTLKQIEKLRPFIGSGNYDRFRAVINNEQKIQQTQRAFRRIFPDARGVESGAGGEVVSNLTNAAISPKTAAPSFIVKNFDRFVRGRGEEYYKNLHEKLTNAILNTNKGDTAAILKSIINDQSKALEASKKIAPSLGIKIAIGSQQALKDGDK